MAEPRYWFKLIGQSGLSSSEVMKPKVICVIMGGGRGTRLYPITRDRCKPAVPLAGKFRLVDIPISNCLNSGMNKIYVLTQFNTASLHRHIQESYKFDPFGGGFVDILSAEQTEEGEDWYQGTADAVRRNMHHFEAFDGDYFLILSGDQLYRMDFREVIEQHIRTGADVTVAAKPFPVSRVADLGIMRVDDDLSIVEFVEKPGDTNKAERLIMSEKLLRQTNSPEDGKYCLASMGIYLFNKRTLFDALQNTDLTDFGREVIPSLLGKVGLYGFLFEDYWEDIGSVQSFFEANLSLTDPVPPFNFYEQNRPIYTRTRYLPASKITNWRIDRAIVADGCILSDANMYRCVVGVRSVIRSGSNLENVVMMGQDYLESPENFEANRNQNIPDMGIGKNCHIQNSIIDKNARIGDNVRLSPEGKSDDYEQGDIVIRDGVLIVLKGGIVPDNTEI